MIWLAVVLPLRLGRRIGYVMGVRPVPWPEPDPQVAGAVRTRIDWKYALGLDLADPGFDHSILSEFRARVAAGGLEQLALDGLLARLAGDGLIKAGGKQRTDSAHVVAAVAALNRLELAGESVRAALEALAAAHPAWVEQRICVADFARRYATPMTSWRPPQSQARRDELAVACARDGYVLLEAVYDRSSPAWLREPPAVDVLRRVLAQNYTRVIGEDGREVIKRREKEPEGDGLPPGHARIASPYDLDARWGVKREEFRLGYKPRVTETCDDAPPCACPQAGAPQAARAGARAGGHARGHDKGCAHLVFPNLITHVATTDATVTDNQMTGAIHDSLAGKDLTPGRHYADSGYLSAALVVSELARHDLALIGPLLADTSAQARAANGYARADFATDYGAQTVTCPRGSTSASRTPRTQHGKNAIVATFSAADRNACPARGFDSRPPPPLRKRPQLRCARAQARRPPHVRSTVAGVGVAGKAWPKDQNPVGHQAEDRLVIEWTMQLDLHSRRQAPPTAQHPPIQNALRALIPIRRPPPITVVTPAKHPDQIWTKRTEPSASHILPADKHSHVTNKQTHEDSKRDHEEPT